MVEVRFSIATSREPVVKGVFRRKRGGASTNVNTTVVAWGRTFVPRWDSESARHSASGPPKRSGAGAYEDDAAVLRPLKEFALEQHLAIVLIHHTRKESSGDPFDKISGTNAVPGMADTNIVLEHEKDGVFGLYVQGRDLEPLELAVSFNKNTCVWTVSETTLEGVRMGDVRTQILTVLADAGEPLSPAAVRNRTGLSGTTVWQTLGRMYKDQQVRKVARGKYSVPDTPDTPDTSIVSVKGRESYFPHTLSECQEVRKTGRSDDLPYTGPVVELPDLGPDPLDEDGKPNA